MEFAPVSDTGSLSGVAAGGPNDVWAVGNKVDSPFRTLTMHWNGVEWSTVASPSVDIVHNNLYAVAASSPSDVWAVGSAGDRPLALRWNGSQWHIVPTPNIDWGVLKGIAVVATNDVWAVGGAGYGSWTTLVLHWDGSAWSQVESPSIGTYTNSLQAISVVSANNIWAVGWSRDDPYTGTYHPALLHWDGIEWRDAEISGLEGSQTFAVYQLFGISMASSTEGWAVGLGWQGNVKKNAFVRWNGSNWTQVDGPSPGGSINGLFGVASVAPGDAWAVGTSGQQVNGHSDPLVLHYGPACVTPTPEASAIPTSVESTGTPLSTSTATNTPAVEATSTAEATGTAEATNTAISTTGTAEATDTAVVATNTAAVATDTALPATSTPEASATALVDTPTETATATATATATLKVHRKRAPSNSAMCSWVIHSTPR